MRGWEGAWLVIWPVHKLWVGGCVGRCESGGVSSGKGGIAGRMRQHLNKRINAENNA